MADLTLYGLGNPGAQYSGTRHNVGYRVVDTLAARANGRWKRNPGPVRACTIRIAAGRARLVKPLVFMNDSGRPLDLLEGVDSGSLLVICDDIHLPLGRLRVRERGGSGGHRGLESIIAHLRTEEFPRLRIGVGSPPPGIEWSEYVLAPFPGDEREAVDSMVEAAADALEMVIGAGVAEAMQRYNRRDRQT
jgi:PTH1 family peptidyl-tRNA hydrolase